MRFTRNIILTLLIIVLCSAMAFASDDSPSPEQAPLEVDWRSLDLQTSAGSVRAVEKTVTDVYNLLDDIFYGDSPYAMGILAQIADMLDFEAGNTSYTIADLQGMTWQIANSINNQLTSTNSILGNIYNENYTTNRKLEYVFSAIEDTINIKWYTFGASMLGATNGLNTTYISSQQINSIYAVFTLNDKTNNPGLLRLFIPYRTEYSTPSSTTFSLTDIWAYRNSNFTSIRYTGDYFFEVTDGGIFIYLFDFNQFLAANVPYYFHVSNSVWGYYTNNGSGRADYIPFDTLDYQIIRTAFYQAKSANSNYQSLDQLVQISAQLSSLSQSSQSGSAAAEALADYFVSPQKQAAEDASQQVINSTLNNFTGNGSGAAKSSDSNAMKDVSGSLQSGLNGGGSVSGATGVFNSGSDFWGWFTQQNSNYINNPYPAPTVNSTRGSGDEIVDFLTPNSNELQDLLRQGGDQR